MKTQPYCFSLRLKRKKKRRTLGPTKSDTEYVELVCESTKIRRAGVSDQSALWCSGVDGRNNSLVEKGVFDIGFHLRAFAEEVLRHHFHFLLSRNKLKMLKEK